MSTQPVVEFKQVSKSFGGRKVLENVSFAVNEGEVLCVLGRSGTGKSVTLKLMIGLIWSDRVKPRILWGCCCWFRRFSRTERAAVGAVFSDD
jgi:phospholipid/cholesterol/gamma-HCH transport system ATP-binding protein